jgi:hypothetical protein
MSLNKFNADAEATVDIPLISGRVVETTAKQHKAKWLDAVKRGINTGLTNFIDNFVKSIVAKDTGSLRAAIILDFRLALFEVLLNITEYQEDFTFEFDIPDLPKYAEFHLDGTYGLEYKDPTTEGTRPTTPSELVEECSQFIQASILTELIAEGFEIGV